MKATRLQEMVVLVNMSTENLNFLKSSFLIAKTKV